MAAKKNTSTKTKGKKDTQPAGKSNLRWYLMLTLKIIIALAVVLLFIYMYWRNQNEEARMFAKIEQLKKEIGAQAASLSDSHAELSELNAELEATELELKDSEEESVNLEKNIAEKTKEMMALQKQKELQREQMRKANSEKMKEKQKEIDNLIAVYQSNIDALSANSPEEMKKIAAEKKITLDKLKESNAAEIAEMEQSYSKLATTVASDIETRKNILSGELEKELLKYDKQLETITAELEPLAEKDGDEVKEKIKLLNDEIKVIGQKRATAQSEHVAQLLSIETNKNNELADMQKTKRASINARKASQASFIAKEDASYKAMLKNDENERNAMIDKHKKQMEQLQFEKDSEIEDLEEQNNSLDSDLSKLADDLSVMKTQKEMLIIQKSDLQQAIEVHKKRDVEIKKLAGVYGCGSKTSTDLANCTTKVTANINAKKVERDNLISTITKKHANGVASLKFHKGWKANSKYTPCPNGATLVGGGPNDTYACVYSVGKFRSSQSTACVPGHGIPMTEKLVLPPGQMKQWFPRLPSCNYESTNVWYIPWHFMRTYDEHIKMAKRYLVQLATFNTTEEWHMFMHFERAYRTGRYFDQRGAYIVGTEVVSEDGGFKGNPRSSESWKNYDDSVFFKDIPGNASAQPFKSVVILHEHPIGSRENNASIGYGVGKYNLPGHLNDRVSSILIHRGYSVHAFEHHDFKGHSEKFTGKVDLRGNRLERRISSVIIEKVGDDVYDMIQKTKQKGIIGVAILEGKGIVPVPRNARLPAIYKITAPTAALAAEAAKLFMTKHGRQRPDSIFALERGNDFDVYTVHKDRPLISENGRYELIIKDQRAQVGKVGGPYTVISRNSKTDMIQIDVNGVLRFLDYAKTPNQTTMIGTKYLRLSNLGVLSTNKHVLGNLSENNASGTLGTVNGSIAPTPEPKPPPKPPPKLPTQPRPMPSPKPPPPIAQLKLVEIVAFNSYHQKEGYDQNFIGVPSYAVRDISRAKVLCIGGVRHSVTHIMQTKDPKIPYVYLNPYLKRRVKVGTPVVIGDCNILTKPAPSSNKKGCHPNNCMVSTEHGAVAIQHLNVGDRIYTPSGYEPIIGFFDKDIKKTAEYYEITMENKQHITISKHHAIPINGRMTDPSLIKSGDVINTVSGITSVVSNNKVLQQGAHHFLVPSGLYYIDNVVCSDYTMHLPLVMFNLVHMYIRARYNIGLPIIYREQSVLSPYWPYHILGKLNASTTMYNICSVLFVPLVILTEFILAVYVSMNKK
ncbi:hypothetical protein EPVG_00034 [Emiliania huxleyi virus 201]|nr:hypothetical protein ELVG_00203 [Emiliania huxleyi virus 203]AEP15580.1 hypothetical protein EQVG_00170 [Emiliania huxleyi virus 207]AEP16034.1 hypothetical protein ERVG_00157 [Emiliania huxleyi virus 208]AET97922.1 hypothetical protein EPVG_00034 [Emiliania huxleyi virus 201]